jgi:hypothetical protein
MITGNQPTNTISLSTSDVFLYLSEDDQVDAIVTNHEQLHQYLDSIIK